MDKGRDFCTPLMMLLGEKYLVDVLKLFLLYCHSAWCWDKDFGPYYNENIPSFGYLAMHIERCDGELMIEFWLS